MQNQPGTNVQLDSAQKVKYVTIFILKDGLGIILLILGGLAAKNTQGQTDTFGPPYFIGAFIVGFALVLAGLLNILLYRRVISDSSASVIQKDIATYTCVEVGFSVVAIMGGFIGLFFVGIFGVPECDPRDFFSHCNYTENIAENRNIAIAILIFLLLSEIVVIGSVVVHCRACRGVGPYNAFRPRTYYGTTVQHQTYTTEGPANVVVSTAPEPPHYAGGRHGFGQNYDFNSRDTQIIVGGQVIDKGTGGFQGAVLSQPENVTIVHPPMGYPQYTDQSGQITGAQGCQTSRNVNDLQEQNRLLREQIALQQQQLNLMQQQQQPARAPSPNLPPPPSYDSCIQDPVKVNLLEEQNQELQNKYYAQQQQLCDISPPGGENIQPSAPPM